MSYLVLARKWRPKTFDDIIGQQHISLTLRNAIDAQRLGHTLVFSGPRGVGKTSTARIVAKTLNCLNENPSQRPCSGQECTSCKEISEGRSFDVQEIDAASHTGVNDIREIIGNVKYLPTSAKVKVYIIDEVHMLSQAAFNALLKTLEEPPAHVLFILATTEIHKIPATILSRCQRYDFREITVEDIKNTLDRIAREEEIDIDERTLFTISKEAGGSLRDSLSLLDQLVGTFGNRIDHKNAMEILGLLETSYISSVIRHIVNRDPGSCLESLHKALAQGINPKKFAEEITGLVRAALMLKICGSDSVRDLSADEKKELEETAREETVESLELMFKMMLEGTDSVQRSYYPEMMLESTLLRLCTVKRTLPIEQIIERIEKLGSKLGQENLSFSKPAGKTSGNTAANGAVADNKAKEHPVRFSSDDFISRVKEINTMLGLHLEKAGCLEKNGNCVVAKFASDSINYNYLSRPSSIRVLKEFANRMYECDIKFEIDEEGNGKAEPAAETESSGSIRDNPVVKDALNIFEGRIISIKPNIKE